MLLPSIPSQVSLQSVLPYSVSVFMIQAIKQFMSCRPLLPHLPPLLHHCCSEFWNSVYEHQSHVLDHIGRRQDDLGLLCKREHPGANLNITKTAVYFHVWAPIQFLSYLLKELYKSSQYKEPWGFCTTSWYLKKCMTSVSFHLIVTDRDFDYSLFN